MAPLYGFGLSQEDERTEAAALALPGGRVLSVASAGDMPLSLIALGADEVVAVDIDRNQLHLCELKRGAVIALDREAATRFLGFLPATHRERAVWFEAVRPHLPAPTQAFWNAHRSVVATGAIWEGRYEHYVRSLRRLTRPLIGRTFRRLVQCASRDDQRLEFAASFDRAWLRALFRLAFRPRVYAGRGLADEALQHAAAGDAVGDRFFARFRDACVGSLARENWLLQVHVLGEVAGRDAVPEYLTARGFQAVRARIDALSFVSSGLIDYLASPDAGTFDGFHLSNLPDWLSPADFERTAALVARRSLATSRVVWRYLHHQPADTEGLRAALHIDRVRSAALSAADRFPVYTVETATIAAQGAIA
jgi:S-adenosylmethionine-diacylglycerol 3-amino-3-carboxypropyl transferase